MAPKFHRLHIQQINRETPNAVTLYFDLPAELKQEFAYKSGQYLTLRLEIGGKHFNRAYSLCSSPILDNSIAVTVKEQESGFVSRYINRDLRAGQAIDVMAPLGAFTAEAQSTHRMPRHFTLVAGGSGVTPLFSILKTILHGGENDKVLLLYGNTDSENIIFHSALQSYAAQFPNRLSIVFALDNTGGSTEFVSGRLDANRIAALATQNMSPDILRQSLFYLCGPPPMMKEAEIALENLQIPAEHIKKEFFTLPDEKPNQQEADADEGREYSVKIHLYGRESSVVVRPDETILEAAIRNDLDPPYACQIAACCTCRAKVQQGEVRMDSREALTDDELEEGYVLTCQAHPLNDNVIINYDE